jgi:iron complex outermembrane receptor protein
VEITTRRGETDQRRLSTAGKIVVGREEIDQYGDTTLGDVLKRLPGVTLGGRPGRGGEIRMRGMGGGYTQILIDGERAPPGLSIEQLAPEQIERIEIYRAPTAETGARAIAGTINIILREPLKLRGDDLRLTLGSERGRIQPSASWTRNASLGETGNYSLTLSASRSDTETETTTRTTVSDVATGQLRLGQEVRSRQQEVRERVTLGSRLQWPLGGGDEFVLQPFFLLGQGRTGGTGVLDQSAGANPAPYATSQSEGDGHLSVGRLLAQLKQRLDDATSMELRGSFGGYQAHNDSDVDQLDPDGAPALTQRGSSRVTDRSWSLNGKLKHLWVDKHSLVGGLELEGARRTEDSLTLINGTPSVPGFDGEQHASTLRLAAYAQDEWDPSANWSAYAGLRWETIRTRSPALPSLNSPRVDNQGTVLSPLLHTVWRFDAPSRDQLRASLTYSYRAPSLQQLTAVPSLSTLYPAPGPNLASSADRAGNPGLQPELATGFELALERYLPTGGMVSVGLFRRNIRDLIRSVIALEDVSWAAVPRWVSRPQNVGSAVSQGLEIDAKAQLSELVEGAAPVSLKANLSLYDSRVDGVPGPDNRIDQQARASANLGIDHRWRGLPLTLGGNLSWTPAYTVQQTAQQSQGREVARVLDVYAQWSFSPLTRLNLSISNLAPRDYVNTSAFVAGGLSQTVATLGPTYRVISLRLETKL